ncbi:MAG: pyridoxamine 5'-phosphate oxidase [bacterium]|nr:pyridoxamine 5'-phosphate oxidase [bacterium]
MTDNAASHQEPFDRFREVFDEALALDIENPDAMVLSTVGEDGRPSSRAVLLKHFDHRGFVFYTNLESRKGREIATNPHVCLNFYWRELGRQVNIEGETRRLSDEEADAYFASRDRGSQLGAWASQQSRPLGNRAQLLAAVAKVEARYLTRAVPRPPHWSGFRVVPSAFEFWVASPFRLHKRTIYRRTAGGWQSSLLYP